VNVYTWTETRPAFPAQPKAIRACCLCCRANSGITSIVRDDDDVTVRELERVEPERVGLSAQALRRIESHFSRRYIETEKIPGALVVVARHGKVALVSAMGRMDVERDKPLREDTLFRIYSMTKPVTSVALMQLYERGAFQLGDPVHKWIPAFESLRVFRQGRHPRFVTAPAERPMTVHDLLTHQSGLTYGFMERTPVDAAYRELRLETFQGNLAEFVTALARLPLEFSPGTRWNYSVSTDVVGHLVELLSGQPLDSYFREHIFEPLGMRDTGFFVPAEQHARLAANYSLGAKGKIALLDDPAKSPFARPRAFLSGGGGLVSTGGDYLRFVEMLRRGGALDGARILGPRTLRFMTTNHLPGNTDIASISLGGPSETRAPGMGFGLGFSVLLDPVRAQTAGTVGDFGWGGMASTSFWVDPVEQLSVVFMTQLVPSSTFPLRPELKALVQGAIVD
jgi:CubicO group peptidase (beta-lactamase class C family)